MLLNARLSCIFPNQGDTMVLSTTVRPYMIREKGSMVVVIPKELRDELKIKQGTTLKVWKERGRLIYAPANSSD